MKKRYLLRLMKFIALLLPIVLFVLIMQDVFLLRLDNDTQRLHGFYNEPVNTLDVVFVGASDVFTGFSPAYAYQKNGFTSYMYAMNANPGTLYQSCLKEVLQRQNPQLILVEVNGFLYNDDSVLQQEGQLRDFSECAPLSLNKLDTIFSYDIDDKLSCLLPFIKYHGEWKDFDSIRQSFEYHTQRQYQPTRLKGVFTRTQVAAQEPAYDIRGDYTTEELTEKSQKCLMEFLDFCQEEGLDNVVFVRFPHKYVENKEYRRFARANRAEELIKERGFTFLNLERHADDIGIDYTNDYYNNDHLNIYGQQKLTVYLSDLIVNQYHVAPMTQTAENQEQWELSAVYYDQYIQLVEKKYEEQEERNMWETLNHLKTLDKMVCENAS